MNNLEKILLQSTLIVGLFIITLMNVLGALQGIKVNIIAVLLLIFVPIGSIIIWMVNKK